MGTPLYNNKLLGQFFEKERRKNLILLARNYSIPSDEAEDIYQEACIVLYENIRAGKLDNINSKVSTYFTRICINKALKFLHDNSKNPTIPIDGLGFSATQIDRLLNMNDGLSQEQKETMRNIVQDLPEPCETLLWSYYGDNLKTDVIAAIVGYANSRVVITKLSQCRSKLKNRFKETKNEF